MRIQFKAVITALAVCGTLLVSAPAAEASGEWMSRSHPTHVKNNSGVTLGQAYGKAWVSTVNANNRATYRRTAGQYSIYVNSYFVFYYHNPQTQSMGWWTDAIEVHNGTYQKTGSHVITRSY